MRRYLAYWNYEMFTCRTALKSATIMAAAPTLFAPSALSAIIEAFNLGAMAHFQVGGEWNDDLMTQVSAPSKIV